jgi:hypothetical protein
LDLKWKKNLASSNLHVRILYIDNYTVKEKFMTEETQTSAQPATGGETAPAQDNDLNLSDLNAMKMIIDVASTRGAFKPSEMVLVGQTYNKLTNFLNSAQKGPSNG